MKWIKNIGIDQDYVPLIRRGLVISAPRVEMDPSDPNYDWVCSNFVGVYEQEPEDLEGDARNGH